MKKVFLVTLAAFMLSAIPASAQVEPGVAVAYGFGAKGTLGSEGRLQIGFSAIDNLRIVPAFTYFFTDFSLFAVDINLHYHLMNTENGGRIWALGGVNLLNTAEGEGATDFGGNLGAGFSGDTGLLNPFAEVKYVFGNASQLMVTAGLFF